MQCYYHLQQLQSSFDLLPPSFPFTHVSLIQSWKETSHSGSLYKSIWFSFGSKAHVEMFFFSRWSSSHINVIWGDWKSIELNLCLEEHFSELTPCVLLQTKRPPQGSQSTLLLGCHTTLTLWPPHRKASVPLSLSFADAGTSCFPFWLSSCGFTWFEP